MTHTELRATERRVALVAFLLYALLTGTLALLHEPWRDEMHAWRLAIDSAGLLELVRNARFEGHPLLWHVLLQMVGHVSRSWLAIAALHWLIACGCAAVVLRYAPFSMLQRVLLLAGYFFAYEYSVVVRGYGLGALLAFGACAAWTGSKRRTVLAGALIFLLANTSLLGLVLALAMAVAFLSDWLLQSDDVQRTWGAKAGAIAVTGAACAATVMLVALQVIPPAANPHLGNGAMFDGGLLWRAADAALIPLKALVPISDSSDGLVVWGTWLFQTQGHLGLLIGLLASGAVSLTALLVAARRRCAVVLLGTGSAAFLLFFWLIFRGLTRHHGYVVITLLVSAWLAFSGLKDQYPLASTRLLRWAEKRRSVMFTVLLLLMIPASIQYVIADARRPFAYGGFVAEWLQAPTYAGVPIVALNREQGMAVAAAMDRPIYTPLEGRSATFGSWGRRVTQLPQVEAADSAVAQLLQEHCRVLVIATPAMDASEDMQSRSELVLDTGRPISGEHFRIWLARSQVLRDCGG